MIDFACLLHINKAGIIIIELVFISGGIISLNGGFM